MTTHPPGSYSIEVSGTISGYASSSEKHTFTINLVDPCLGTTLSIEVIPDFEMNIGEAAIPHSIIVKDLVSESHGNQDGITFCGARTYTEVGTNYPWLTLGASDGQISIGTSDASLAMTEPSVTVSV